MTLPHLSSFYLPWSAALAASTAEPVTIGALTIEAGGFTVPIVQVVLAIAGVLLARPLARKKEAALPLSHFLIVTIAMLVVAVAWVTESHPGVLFTFVVSIGLGFSGYSLIETAGSGVEDLIKRVVAQAADLLSSKGTPK